jgi:hypothetical protein
MTNRRSCSTWGGDDASHGYACIGGCLVRDGGSNQYADGVTGPVPSGGAIDAEGGPPRVHHPSRLHELARDQLDRAAGEANARRGTAALLGIVSSQRRDADHRAVQADERAAAVAGVDRCARLDGRREHDAIAFVDGATGVAHDAVGDRARQAQWIADSKDDVARLDFARVGEGGGARHTASTDFDDSEIVGRVDAHQRRAEHATVAQRHLELRARADDVSIGDDAPVGVEHHTRPQAAIRGDLHN